jgi:hypothetical protein
MLVLSAAVALMLVPASAHAASLHVVFPQTAEVTVVQGSSTDFTLEVQAFGATDCDATAAPQVVINTLYSLDAAGDIASAQPAPMPLVTDETRGDSTNCYIKNPVVVPLTATVASDTPPGDYTGIIRYGKGGDGDVDLDGPQLTIHVLEREQAPVVLPPPQIVPPVVIVLGERIAPKPVLGKSVMLTLVNGTVTYIAPGKTLQTLHGSVIVQNGTKVDATDGTVKVTVIRDRTGVMDSADVWDGGFKVNQGIEKNGRGLTTFQLRDGLQQGGPKKGASAARARVSRANKKRSLWVNGKGNFKTRGKRASAIVRGTYWHTEETDRGTKVSVDRGLVAVRDLVRKKTVLVGAGHSYTATVPARVTRRIPAFTGRAR